MSQALVSILMGSKSDWPTMEHAGIILDTLGIPYEAHVLSAHRTPDALLSHIESAESKGIEIFIAGAGGAAHLGGVIASKTVLPVIGIPMQTSALNGMDSLLSIVQMPGGIPVATMAIGKPGAINAGLFAASILAVKFPEYRQAIRDYRAAQRKILLENAVIKI